MTMNRQMLIDAWVKDSQITPWSTHKKCSRCGYPHSPCIMCGAGAHFGTATFGSNRYGVDSSNVDYYVSLRMSVAKGHHWKNDNYFYIDNDCVVIRTFVDFNGHPNIKEIKIPIDEWATIVSQVELMCQTGDSKVQTNSRRVK